jgi:hypothetical protein
MKSKLDIPKIQHYVPQFLLSNFAHGKKPQIYVYDKQTEVSYRTNIRNVAAESDLYNLEWRNIILTLEPSLGDLETNASKVIKTIVREESIHGLSLTEKVLISVFVLTQQMRTPYMRKSMLHMDQLIQNAIRQMGGDPNQVENYHPLDKDGARLLSIKMLSNLKEFVPHIMDKQWVLLKGKRNNPFYISDSPVTLQNIKDFGPRGNIGLGVEGIEIYLPISSTLTLAMYCSTTVNEIRERYKRYKHVSLAAPWIANAISKNKDPFCVEKMIAGFDESYEMDFHGFSEFLGIISSHGEGLDQVIVAMESTGCDHINLYSFLASQGIRAVVVNPLLIANYAKRSLRKTKTDKKDARTIAKFLLDHGEEISQLSLSQDLQDLRDLARERESLCHLMSATKVEIKRTTFPELESIGNLYSGVMLRFLQQYPSARLVRGGSLKAIGKALKGPYVGTNLRFLPRISFGRPKALWPW